MEMFTVPSRNFLLPLIIYPTGGTGHTGVDPTVKYNKGINNTLIKITHTSYFLPWCTV